MRHDKFISQAAIARVLGVPRASVCAWQLGQRRPTAPMRIKIREAFGIAAEAWLTDEEREFLARAEPAARSAFVPGSRYALAATEAA